MHKIEGAIEESYEKIPEPNRPSWIFPGDIVELHAPEDDNISHDKSDDETTTNGEQQQEESLTISGETQEEHGNIPHGLSPLRQYVPAGAEGDEANSSTSTYGEEETVEEELANYFSNPSYRAANLRAPGASGLRGRLGRCSPCTFATTNPTGTSSTDSKV